jgi:polysaccharide pyruvyl transferase WcaK-like protein
MLLGKLVVATAYSGNMTYMTPHNSIPVAFQLVEPVQTGWQFGRAFAGASAVWAQPDAVACVAALRQAYEQPELRAHLARVGQQDVLRQQQLAWSAPYMRELSACVDTSPRAWHRQLLRVRVAANEVLDPTLRALNGRALWARFKGKRLVPPGVYRAWQSLGGMVSYLKQAVTDASIVLHNFLAVGWPLARRVTPHCQSEATAGAFLILPCDPVSPIGSMGDLAMLTGLMQSLLASNPRARFTLVGTHTHQILIPQVGSVDVVSAWEGRSGSIVFDELLRRHEAMFALGADVLDGKYGAALVCRLAGYCSHAAQIGLPTTILGFSFSESPRRPAVLALSGLNPRVRVNVRDARSLDRVLRRTGVQATLSADIAFLLQPVPCNGEEVHAWIQKMRQEGRTLVGVNLNSHAFAVPLAQLGPDVFIEGVRQQLHEVGVQNRLAFVLIPHDFKTRSGDVQLLTRLEQALLSGGFPQVIYTEQHAPASIKALVGSLDLVLTGRMHLAIAALGMGTPTLCIAYQDKFEGLFEHFGLDPKELLQVGSIKLTKLGAHLVHAIQHRSEARAQIVSKIPQVLELAQRNLLGVKA